MPRKHIKQTHKHRKLSWMWVTLGAVAIAFAGILGLRSQGNPTLVDSATQTMEAVEISPEAAYAKYQEGAFILDVRSQEEFNQVHIERSTLIPLDQLPSRLNELPQDKDIVLVCLSGHRSLSGTVLLQQAGFKRVFCLSGGLQAWSAAGYQLVGALPSD
jgi:rhodanese-related sulfurtransferase